MEEKKIDEAEAAREFFKNLGKESVELKRMMACQQEMQKSSDSIKNIAYAAGGILVCYAAAEVGKALGKKISDYVAPTSSFLPSCGAIRF